MVRWSNGRMAEAMSELPPKTVHLSLITHPFRPLSINHKPLTMLFPNDSSQGEEAGSKREEARRLGDDIVPEDGLITAEGGVVSRPSDPNIVPYNLDVSYRGSSVVRRQGAV